MWCGLVVPHVARLLIGPLHRRMLPVTALIGALLQVWTDVLARSVLYAASTGNDTFSGRRMRPVAGGVPRRRTGPAHSGENRAGTSPDFP